jgi:uncharacterized delta-60 repeat protein
MRATRRALWATGLVAAVLAISLAAAPGDLDPTFEFDGKLTTEFTGWARGIAIDSQDRIVITGFTEDPLERVSYVPQRDFLTARFHASGISLDLGFGNGHSRLGTAISDFSSGFFGDPDFATAVAIDAAGRTVVAGSSEHNHLCTDPPCGWNQNFALARYTVQGIPDATFGTTGTGEVTFDFGDDTTVARATAVLIDSVGRIVVAGYVLDDGDFDFAIARLLPNGDLDSSFNEDGRILVGFGVNEYLYAATIDSQGRIIAIGIGRGIAVVRLTSSGQLDSTFAGDGKMEADYGRSINMATGVVTDELDRIVVGGWTADYADGNVTPLSGVDSFGNVVFNQSANFALTRFLEDGTLDSSFGNGGRTFLDFNDRDDIAHAMTVDAAGRLILVGSSFDLDTREDVAVARFTSSGQPDLTFGLGGKVTTRFSFFDVALGVATDSRGRIVVTGSTWQQGADQSHIILARYDNGGVTMARTTELVGMFGDDGIIANPGITEALTAKLTTAEKFIDSGDIKTAGNVLGAFVSQVESQAGKQIPTSAVLDGVRFDPAAVLIGQALGLVDDLNTLVQVPLFGYVTDSAGNGVEGAAISVVDSTGKTAISGATDAAGFYYFVGTGALKIGAQYSVRVTSASSAAVTPLAFTWKNSKLTMAPIVLN